ncbi:hypothetical protein BH09PSE6_BH09PSE6_08830 [soil metagenome]
MNNRPSDEAPLDFLLLHTLLNLCITSDVKESLDRLGFGRVHHRILFFVNVRPGQSVSALMDLMRVSHQNLRIPMQDLVRGGFIETASAEHDGRVKCLYLTKAGRKLIETLNTSQFKRIEAGFAKHSKRDVDAFLTVHLSLIDSADAVWAVQTRQNNSVLPVARKAKRSD